MNSTTAWTYAVVSTGQQLESIDFQEERTMERARENGWTVTKSFKDDSSGKLGTRALFNQLLNELEALPKAERPARVIMTRLDRTGRGIGLEPLEALARIRRLGVTIHTIEDGDNAFVRASDLLKPIMRIITGALENESRADKSRAGHARRKAEGKHGSGNAPYGTVIVNGHPVAYEPEAAIVRELFARRMQGWGYVRLAKWASRQAPAKVLRDGNARTMRWGTSTIQRLLRCSTLRGLVVEETTFDDVQAIKKESFVNARATRWPWPLRGAVRCTCGKALTTSATGNKYCRIRYYVCNNVGVHLRHPHHRAEVLEAKFAQLLTNVVAMPDILAQPIEVDPGRIDSVRQRRASLQRDLAECARRRDRVWRLAEDASIPGADLAARLEAIASEEKRLHAALGDVDEHLRALEAVALQNGSVAEVIADLAGLWPGADEQDQREVAKAVGALVEGLYVPPDVHELVFGRDVRLVSAIVRKSENMRQSNTLRDVDMAQRRADNAIVKKFVESINE